jgi:hypothetical protein
VLQGEGLCGCNKPQCVQINEECLQKFEGWDCPAGTVKHTGTTPCGLSRDMCIKCDINQFNNKTCDPKCYTIVQSKDVNGCPMEKCERKLCPDISPKNSSTTELVSISQDECGCVSYTIGLVTPYKVQHIECDACVFLPGPVSNFGLVKQTINSIAAENFCQQHGGHLASFKSLAEALMISEGLWALKAQEGNWSDYNDIRTGGKGEGTNYSFTDGTPFPNDVCKTTNCGQPWYSSHPTNGFSSDYCLNFWLAPSKTTKLRSMHDAQGCSQLRWFLCKF